MLEYDVGRFIHSFILHMTHKASLTSHIVQNKHKLLCVKIGHY